MTETSRGPFKDRRVRYRLGQHRGITRQTGLQIDFIDRADQGQGSGLVHFHINVIQQQPSLRCLADLIDEFVQIDQLTGLVVHGDMSHQNSAGHIDFSKQVQFIKRQHTGAMERIDTVLYIFIIVVHRSESRQMRSALVDQQSGCRRDTEVIGLGIQDVVIGEFDRRKETGPVFFVYVDDGQQALEAVLRHQTLDIFVIGGGHKTVEVQQGRSHGALQLNDLAAAGLGLFVGDQVGSHDLIKLFFPDDITQFAQERLQGGVVDRGHVRVEELGSCLPFGQSHRGEDFFLAVGLGLGQFQHLRADTAVGHSFQTDQTALFVERGLGG